ncbi:MAG: leucine-rich repeat protein [Mobilitalea sp.]
MKKVKLGIGITLFFMSIIFASIAIPVSAASVSNPYFTPLDVKEKTYETGGCYLEGWPLRVSSLQTEVNSDGTISVLNWTIVNDMATIYEYDQNAKYIRTLKLEAELSKVGGFTKDAEGNYYVAFGKNVPEGAFNDISVAIVKYNKDGKKINKYLMQAKTYDEKWSKDYSGVMQPFDEACRLEISGDMIAVYFGKSGFMAPDGDNHQSSYGFILNKDTFARLSGRNSGDMIMPSASHSYNQIILPVEDGFVFADQGDYNPRSFVVEKVVKGSDNARLLAFDFKQSYIYQLTYSDLGGLAKTSEGYILAGTYENTTKDGSAEVNGSRNLFIVTMDENLTTVTKPIYLTNYTDTDTETAVHPKIVQIGDNRYLLLWEKYNTNTELQTAYMATIDKNGKLLDSIKELPHAVLNAMDMLQYNPKTGYVHWAVNQGQNTVLLYSLNPSSKIISTIPVNPDFIIRNGVFDQYLGNKDKVVIPEGITEITNWAFFDASNLKSVTIPNSVVKIGKNAFSHADEDIILYGKSGSYAQAYAKKYGIIFIDPEIAPTVKGVSNNKYYSSEVEIIFNYGTATLNGKAINNGSYLYKDGSYRLVVDNGFKVLTKVSFVIDTTAPVIELRDSSNNALKSGAITNKSFKLTYKENNFKSISVTKDKKNMMYPKGGLFTAKGTYVVTITDKAGNRTKVTFTIKNY